MSRTALWTATALLALCLGLATSTKGHAAGGGAEVVADMDNAASLTLQ